MNLWKFAAIEQDQKGILRADRACGEVNSGRLKNYNNLFQEKTFVLEKEISLKLPDKPQNYI